MRPFAHTTQKNPGAMRLATGAGRTLQLLIPYNTSTAHFKWSETTIIPSTIDWRAWWRVESRRVGTDWASLHRQLVGVWRELRSLADEASS